jgi:hypothetical protein
MTQILYAHMNKIKVKKKKEKLMVIFFPSVLKTCHDCVCFLEFIWNIPVIESRAFKNNPREQNPKENSSTCS